MSFAFRPSFSAFQSQLGVSTIDVLKLVRNRAGAIMFDQSIVGSILVISLALFIWDRWRHDVVAFLALITAVLAGVVPISEAFLGFGHPAVITVAGVLVISRALQYSGIIDIAAKNITGIVKSPLANIVLLTGIGAILSGFMNNIGALALLMPLALQTSRSPATILMPLSFGTILGGMMTEIGTPPNIIIATYREEIAGEGFGLFDFFPVGGSVALIGLIFLVTVGWRLIPSTRRGRKTSADLLKDSEYLTEARVTPDSRAIGKTVRQLERMVDNDVLVISIIRGEHRFLGRLRDELLRENDIIILRAEVAAFQNLLEATGMGLVGHEGINPESLRSDEISLLEAVVMPGSRVEMKSAESLALRARYGVNMLAIARQGQRVKKRLSHVLFRAGDVLLVQGEADMIQETMTNLGFMPLAERGLRPHRKRQRYLPLIIFIAAILAIILKIMPVQIAFSAAVAALVIFETITPREVYDSIDWSIIVLLGAMIPLGHALQTTGATDTLAQVMLSMAHLAPPWAILILFMVLVMILTNLMNNAAAAIVCAPISVSIAHNIGVNVDPFLMATAIGASSAFLTPIGHQNNVLVMGPGGYRFGDFWRMGLPLQILIVAVSAPLILIVWPM